MGIACGLNVLLLVSTLLLFAVPSHATPVTRTKVNSDSRQLAEFHAYLARQRRQAPDICPKGTWFDNRDDCASVDYTQFDTLGRRASGLLAAPMAQGLCGSCWAFASTGTFTDLRNLAAGQSTAELSPQHMTTCATDSEYITINGCCGSKTLDYGAIVLKNSGATTDTCVPYDLGEYYKEILAEVGNTYLYYENKDFSECQTRCKDGTLIDLASIQISNYETLVDEKKIIAAINRGPVIALMISTVNFSQGYENGCGVYCSIEEEGCGHAVEIVDYGTTDTGIDFYVVKNSWGDDWGEDGYFRIRRGDLLVGSEVVELFLSANNLSNNTFNSANSMSVCTAEKIRNPNNDEVIMIVANFVIDELNRRSSIRCPDNVTIAGPISLSSVMAATMQAVAGFNYDVTMRVEVMGCCRGGATISANISAAVFQDPGGNFTFISYSYSSSMAMRMSLMLLFGAAVLALFLPNY